MQRHAIGEGLKIRSWTRRCFCFKGKTVEMYWSNCGVGTPHLAYALRNTAAVTGLRKLQSSYVFFPWYIYWHTEMWRWTSRWKKSLSLWVSLPFPHALLSFCHIQYDGINAYFQCKHPSLNPCVLLRFTWLFFFFLNIQIHICLTCSSDLIKPIGTVLPQSRYAF